MRILATSLSLLMLIVVVNGSEPDRAMCPCAKIYWPVCGDDNVTYGNMCEFECQKAFLAGKGKTLKIAKEGKCK